MNREKKIHRRRLRRSRRVRRKVRGDGGRPRLSVFRSHRHIYAQLIDDSTGHTLCTSSSRTVCGAFGGRVEHARQVGEDLAKRAAGLKVERVRFDRGRYRFHGRLKALAEAVRKGGLEF
ncbi:MAG: 50S ribosomal protein L18 [Planctomycetota bacterium]